VAEKAKPGEEVLERTRPKTKKPPLYAVVLHNDDYTTQQFVTAILESIFYKSPSEAYAIMMAVHTKGWAACGAYTYEVAETKVDLVHRAARAEGFPLRASLEEA